MTKPIPRELYDPRAAAEAGMERLVDWDDRLGEDAWDAGRLWWRESPRVQGASEWSRRGIGLARWYDFARWEGSLVGVSNIARHVTEALAHGDDPEVMFNSESIRGVLVTASGPMKYLGRVDPDKGIEAVFAYVDEQYPVPHPGFRTGQVWALRLRPGDGWTTDTVTATGIRDNGEATLAWATDIWAAYSGAIRRPETQAAAIERLSRLHSAILLHDPLMPNRAPWSP